MTDKHPRIRALEARNILVRAGDEPYVARPEFEGVAVPLILTREVRASDPDDRGPQ